MFRRREEPSLAALQPQAPQAQINSVLGPGITWKGNLSGSGGIRIEGALDGEIALRGILVVAETGRITCENIRANTVIIAGMVKGNITAEKVEIRSTGRVWGDVVTAAFATEEGAFLRGQIRMEEKVEIGLEAVPDPTRVAEENLPLQGVDEEQ
ncbi:MAG: bactofilin family protein [Chloroflexota bacterium]|jgi:cytoskeletal protein CcmA (bactofilin family)